MKPLRLVVALVIVALVVGGGYVFWTNRTPFAERVPAVGTKAPDIHLADATGRMVQLSDFHGTPVYIYFWANWCPPCKEQLKVFQKMKDDPAAKSVSVVAVALDEIPETLAEDYGIVFPVLLINDRVRTSYGDIRNVPATFLVDGDGFIVAKSSAYLSLEELAKLLHKARPAG